MPKTLRNVYDKCLSFPNLMSARNRASESKNNKKEVIRFTIDLETNIMNIYQLLKQGKYRPGKYRSFIIYEPKERKIKALPYLDRVVQQWYVEEFIKPYILPRFIIDSFACIPERGTHLAVHKLQHYMKVMRSQHDSYYILKCDVQKFFYSINKRRLYELLQTYIQDKKLLALTYYLI